MTPTQAHQPDGLTEREREVVRLISEGLSNKDIANRLCISSITVRHHLTSIFDKLGVSNRQKLLIRAHQNGLTRPPAMA
jgi:DNA-binding NarL/FixJ family response regulator